MGKLKHIPSDDSDSSVQMSHNGRKNRCSTNKDTACNAAKKKKSSEKERVRNQEIKSSLEEIRQLMPFVEKKDLSKIRTLRLASEYINHLKRILSNEMVHCTYSGTYRPLTVGDFEHVVMKEMQVTNSYKERAEHELSTKVCLDINQNSPSETYQPKPTQAPVSLDSAYLMIPPFQNYTHNSSSTKSSPSSCNSTPFPYYPTNALYALGQEVVYK